MEKRGLGRGLSALLGETLSDEASVVREIRLDQIRPNPYQPRQVFDDAKHAEMVQSVREHGILQPVLLRRTAVDRYELIAGERRFRAAQEAGLRTVPAIIKEYADAQVLEVALIENVQREDINAVEAAMAYRRLIDEFGLTQQDLARRVGKAQPTISNTLRLLDLPEPIQESVMRGEITEGHARALLAIAPQAQLTAWQDIKRRGLSVRESERLARDLKQRPQVEAAVRSRSDSRIEERPTTDPNHAAIEEALQIALHTKVRVRKSGGVGRIEIEFYSEDELEGLVERIIGEGSK